MFNLISRINQYLSLVRKKQLIFLFILIIFLSLTEAISLASIIPFIGVFMNPDLFFSSPWLSFFINFFEINNNDQLFLLVTIIFVSLLILSFLTRLLTLYLTNNFTFFIEADLKTKIFEYNINQSYGYHLLKNSNVIMSNITQKTQTIAIFSNSFIQILANSLTVLFILGVLLIIQPIIILSVSFVVISFFGIISLINKNKILNNSKKISQNKDSIVSVFQDSVGYIGEIILYSLHETFISKFNKSSKQIAKSETSNTNIQQSPRIYLEYGSLFCLVILIFYFNQSKIEIVNSFTILAALGYGAQKIIPLINRIYVCFLSMRHVQASVDDALNVLDDSKIKKNKDLVSEKIILNNSIKLNNIFFSYKNDENYIIKNINFEIKKGDRIGIKGTTGSGKSTLGNILIGLLDPTKGKLFIDDILINSKNKSGWQRNISVIPQNIFLNDTTIAENIAIGIEKNKIDLEKIKKVTKQAQISDFIESKPNQYYEKVGEKGVRLSGGQKQRIGIARALYREAKIILFDEATNQLDVDTETSIMNSIYSLDKDITVILIAHRLSTLDKCNKIIDLSKDFKN